MSQSDDHSVELVATGGSRPTEITAEHLTRLAINYMRQSSPTQVLSNSGSTDYQRGLADLPRQWGWSENLILTIDDDLGFSGKRLEGRSGFRKMCDLIDAGRVGLVVVADVDRLSRDPFAGEYFLRRAIRHGVLLWAKGRLYATATATLAELFNLRLQVLLSWWDNEGRRDRFIASKQARLAKGFAVSRPPIGLVQITKGEWTKDPDPDIRAAIGRIPGLYRRCLSIRKAVLYCHERGWLFPRRVRGEVRWGPVSPMQVGNLLRNPLYTDAYVYHRLKVLAADDERPRSVERRPRSEWIIVRGHHEAYLTWEEWEEIQDLLTSRHWTRHPPTGNGPAILQGIIYCLPCGRAIRTVYHKRVGTQRLPMYVCQPADRIGNKRRCFSQGSSALDRFVEQEIFKALSPASLDTALTMIEEVISEHKELERTHQRWNRQAEDEVEEARRRYLRVDDSNPMVKLDMEVQLQRALQHKQQLEADCRRGRRESIVSLDEQDARELVTHAQDLPTLWQSASHEDRKRLVQTVIRRVWVHGRTEESTEIEIEWAGGLRERRSVLHKKGLERQVAELWQTGCKRVPEIVAALGSQGVLNSFGLPISQQVVWHALKRLGLHRGPTWVRALCLIREKVMEGRTGPEIRAYLESERVPHWRGSWTAERLSGAIWRLHQGRLPEGVLPLPQDVRATPSLVTRPEVVELIRRRRADGCLWRVIVEEFQSRGIQTAKGKSYTIGLVASLYHRWKRRGMVP